VSDLPISEKMNGTNKNVGRVIRIAGPAVGATDLKDVRLYDVVWVGEWGLVGEVIRLFEGVATIQVYEDTSGLSVGDMVRNTGLPLAVKLGPGLLGRVYDGLQRPLDNLAEMGWDFIKRGLTASPLPNDVLWDFTPCITEGEEVGPGDVLGVIPETPVIEHRILVPPGMNGRVAEVRTGAFKITDVVVILELLDGHHHQITLVQEWPVRRPRPVRKHLDPCEPLVTGTRVIDIFFPVAKGGAAIIPGGFGTGKTVIEHTLARWADADVVVYVGCGERGNEMAEVIKDFPKLEDPRTGESLMNRTVLIANTSNMPVAAREASIYTGITIAEYYRDMGYDVLMLADSTSRWGEALREISGRLEEIPGEEGYPAYLGARLSAFYERSGRVIPLGKQVANQNPGEARSGSVTLVGAVSPPGADFSEPMTQSSMRVAGTFWGLDYDLSRRRHFPAINWNQSYSLYDFRSWYDEFVAEDWGDLTREAMALLHREDELLKIVQLVGWDALSEVERGVLAAARMLREDLLQQSSYDPVDRFCPLDKAYGMLKTIIIYHQRAQAALQEGISLEQVTGIPVMVEIARMKNLPDDNVLEVLQSLVERVHANFDELEGKC
jgi:V/A-type H+-transporting ATPase subunit A